jgi:hypothetical protein
MVEVQRARMARFLTIFHLSCRSLGSPPATRQRTGKSVARDEAGPESDVDILVTLDRGVGLIKFSSLASTVEGDVKPALALVDQILAKLPGT